MNQGRTVLTKIMEMSGVVNEIESNFNPMNLSGLTQQEIDNLIKTMDNIIRAATDVRRYLS